MNVWSSAFRRSGSSEARFQGTVPRTRTSGTVAGSRSSVFGHRSFVIRHNEYIKSTNHHRLPATDYRFP
ncbi:MAG: hypothetical protein J2P31_00060, partial [Blastocatellia bacterium]|nr:hypothetical protein [Blastocatellia bacterium]